MGNILAALVLATATVPAADAQQDQPPVLWAFEFIGCSGDFEGRDATPEIWRTTAEGTFSFLAHTLAACGLAGRAPVVTGGTRAIDLSYEPYSPTGVAIMCECKYWAKFTFG